MTGSGRSDDRPDRLPARTLEGQVAAVSGGLGDIGRAVSRELGSRGAKVGIGDLTDPTSADPFLEDLGRRGVDARYDRVDVADADAVEAWVGEIEAALGVPTLLICNAAVVTEAGLLEIPPEAWRREVEVNLDGSFHLARTGARRMVAARRPGRIVFVGSWAGHSPHPQIPAYSVSKAAMRMLSRCMALELAQHSILVNEIALGVVDAGLSGRIFDREPERRQSALERVPVGALITPAEVATEVARLCDPDNRHVTGTTFLMDGGLSLLGGPG